MSKFEVPAPVERRDATVSDLVDGDVFSLDGGATWHRFMRLGYEQVQCSYVVSAVLVYGTGQFLGSQAVRLAARRDTACLIGVRRITDPHAQRATVDDTVGRIRITFRNAINGRCTHRYRLDIAAARRLVAHFHPYNNTDYSADVVVDTDGIRTATQALDLRVDGRYVFCRCFNDDEDLCDRVDELAEVIGRKEE